MTQPLTKPSASCLGYCQRTERVNEELPQQCPVHASLSPGSLQHSKTHTPGSHSPCTGIGAAASGSSWRGPCPVHGQSPHLQEHMVPDADKPRGSNECTQRSLRGESQASQLAGALVRAPESHRAQRQDVAVEWWRKGDTGLLAALHWT